ncbi:hypothetical protein B566_EDAN009749 [Ephemera danica]|nr:hypothetical protein B566_EDAN009749 [Ephemera danica]
MEGNLLYHSRKIGLNKLAAFAEDDINSECVESTRMDVEPQLPLLMCRSKNINLISSVHMCLAALFDCRVSKLELRQVDLQWILAILLENDPEIKDQCIDFTLTYQPHTSPKDKVSIGMSALALQKIWRCIRSKNIKETEADFDEVALLFSSVGQHIQATFNLQVEHMGLTGLSSTFGNFLSTGKVIFTSMEVAEVILRFLTNQLLLEEKFGVELFSKQERMEACNT